METMIRRLSTAPVAVTSVLLPPDLLEKLRSTTFNSENIALIGIESADGSTVYLIDFIELLDSQDLYVLGEQVNSTRSKLPGGVCIVGLLLTSEHEEEELRRGVVTETLRQHVDKDDDPILFVSRDTETLQWFSLDSSAMLTTRAGPTEFTIQDSSLSLVSIWSNFSRILTLPVGENAERTLRKLIDELQEQISHCGVLKFQGLQRIIRLSTDCDSDGGGNDDVTLEEQFDFKDVGLGALHNRIQCSMYLMPHLDPSVDVSMRHSAPIAKCNNQSMDVVQLRVSCIALALVQPAASLKIASLRLLQSIRRQLYNYLKCLWRFSDSSENRFCHLIPYAFHPYPKPYPLCVFYPRAYTADDLTPYRRHLHEMFGLPSGHPLLRPSMSLLHADSSLRQPLLRFPQCVPRPSFEGTVTLTRGVCHYYHYMQDDFNDRGWGCAYRSFQTIWSWLKLQGYTDKDVPSHAAVQQALVDVGDKQSTFVGSRQWVGSLELSYCLDHMLEISSRIVSTNTGGELASKARELAFHFDTIGSPVMIGGGVLAHAILGVNFNETSGEVEYLVLDPHYTGTDDNGLKPIMDKGFFAWKPVTFWQENAFYNVLCPQTPSCV